MKNFFYKILVAISLLTTFSGAVYFVYKLNWIGIALTVTLAIISFIVLQNRINLNDTVEPMHSDPNKNNWLFITIYTGFYIVAISLLLKARTDGALISPWQVVPGYFFLDYFFLTLLLFFIARRSRKLFLLFVSLHFWLFSAVALIVYKIGYGFDPHIHGAALELINKTGLILPKTIYYSGYYGLITILNKIFFLPLSFLNKTIVPLFSAIFLPIAVWLALKERQISRNPIPVDYPEIGFLEICLISLFTLPIPFSIVSTPQNLAYVFLLIIIFLAVNFNREKIIVLISLALATFFIHPIAGIPAIMFVCALLVWSSKLTINLKRLSLILIFLISLTALPLAFGFFQDSYAPNDTPSAVSRNIMSVLLEPIKNYWAQPLLPNTEKPILNFVYAYGFNLSLVIFALIFGGVLINYKRGETLKLNLLFTLVFFLSYLLTKIIPFNFLISYERSDYPERVLMIALFFALPFVLESFNWLSEKILLQDKATKIILTCFASLAAVSALYLSYPRFDNYFNSRGLSTGKFDLEAVDWIDKNSTSDFAVLANQQISAGALHEFGFKKYYKGDIFYYPVPTGGSLYQIYLGMVYDYPSRLQAQKAYELTGAHDIYFVLNKYWWAFTKIRDEAKLEADSYKVFGDGEVWVFRYSFNL